MIKNLRPSVTILLGITLCLMLGVCKGHTSQSKGGGSKQQSAPSTTPVLKESKKDQEIKRLFRAAKDKCELLKEYAKHLAKDTNTTQISVNTTISQHKRGNQYAEQCTLTEAEQKQNQADIDEVINYLGSTKKYLEEREKKILELQQALLALEQELLEKGVEQDKIVTHTRLTKKELSKLKKGLEDLDKLKEELENQEKELKSN